MGVGVRAGGGQEEGETGWGEAEDRWAHGCVIPGGWSQDPALGLDLFSIPVGSDLGCLRLHHQFQLHRYK